MPINANFEYANAEGRYHSAQTDEERLKALEEMMKNLGPNGLQKFQKMNVIQQESYAKALGMSTDELADSLVKQKQLQSLGNETATALKKRVKELQVCFIRKKKHEKHQKWRLKRPLRLKNAKRCAACEGKAFPFAR